VARTSEDLLLLCHPEAAELIAHIARPLDCRAGLVDLAVERSGRATDQVLSSGWPINRTARGEKSNDGGTLAGPRVTDHRLTGVP